MIKDLGDVFQAQGKRTARPGTRMGFARGFP